MGHYNRIALELAERPEEYAPVLELDPVDGGILWEPWIGGFERAMRLRPDVWEEIVRSDDEEASASISMIVALNDMYRGRLELTEEAEEELDRLAPGLIRNSCATSTPGPGRGNWRGAAGMTRGFLLGSTGTIHRHSGTRWGATSPAPAARGRKYKRCCGAH